MVGGCRKENRRSREGIVEKGRRRHKGCGMEYSAGNEKVGGRNGFRTGGRNRE